MSLIQRRFKTIIGDFKGIVSSLDKVDEGGCELKRKVLNPRFLINLLFLSDINSFLSKSSKSVQRSSNLPWDYSNNLDYMKFQLDLMIDQFIHIGNQFQKDYSEGHFKSVWNDLSDQHFTNFKGVSEILLVNKFQNIELKTEQQKVLRGSTGPFDEMKRLIDFGKQYMAALRDNFKIRFDCETMKLCRKFRIILDSMPYIYPHNNFIATEDPLFDIKSFSKFVEDIPLLILKGEENLSTLLFQLRELRKIMFELLSQIRNDGNKEQINSSLFLKKIFSSLDDDTMYEIKYLMSCVVTFPVSEAIVESWGSVIDKVINDKVAFAESVDVSRIDITEKFVFTKRAATTWLY